MLHNERTPLFPRYAMNPNLQIFLNKKNPYQRVPTNMDRLYEEDYDLTKEYYSPSEFPSLSNLFRPRNRSFVLLIFTILFLFLLLLVLFRGNEDTKVYTKMEDTTTETQTTIRLEAQTFGVPKAEAKLNLEKYLKSIDPEEVYPDDVNAVKPHHIRVIGAMGDSLTIGSRARNYIEDNAQRYPGNVYFTGMDAEIDGHLTIYNIFRVIAEKAGSKLYGGSTGEGYGGNTGFNVAVGGMKSDDIPRQAKDLVDRIRNHSEIDIKNDWKLVSLWIGTNDVGDLGYGINPPIPADAYKAKIEEGLAYLKENLPRTIVSIIGMFPAQLLTEARSILQTGKRAKDPENQKKIDELSDGYRRASFEIQNEKKFDSKEFTVVVQPFATEYNTVFVDRIGNYNSSFYSEDLFHISKLGHAILAKNYWQNLFEPVGEKTTKAELGDTSPRIFELDKDNSFIKTIGNSK